MESKWLQYLRVNAPELYADAKADTRWAAKWRDERIAQLEAELSSLKPEKKANSELLNEGVDRETALGMLGRAAHRHRDSALCPVYTEAKPEPQNED